MAVTRWLQHRASGPSSAAELYVFLGDAEVLVPAVAAASVILWGRNRDRGLAAWRLAAGLLAVSLIAVVLKRVIPHPGPTAEFQRRALRPGPHIPQSTWSFPSGHTSRAAYFAAHALRRWPWLAAVLVLAMMTALVYLGDHWTTDVIGGLCLGWVCAETARWITERHPRRPGR